MKRRIVDTNVILRYLVEDPATIDPQFKGVYSFFTRLERGELNAELTELVVFQAYFVLTGFYGVSTAEAAEKLERLVSFKGLHLASKDVVLQCLSRLQKERLDIVDAYILAWSERHGIDEVYSFDGDLEKMGLTLLEVG